MRNILFIVMALFIISCGASPSTDSSPEKDMKIMVPESGCYASFSGKDTILLKIEVFPNVVNGILKYHIREKDKNEGTIEGKFAGDTLFADYTFSSEGKTSVREVAFLVNDGQAIEGYGNMEEKNGKMVFTDKAGIDFSEGTRLVLVDCAGNDSLFRLGPLEKRS